MLNFQTTKNKWPIETVNDCFTEIINGTTVKQNETTGVPVTRIETIQNSRFDLGRIKYINKPPENILNRYKYQKGDIAFSHINSLEHVGKVALYDGEPELLIHGMNLLRLRPNNLKLVPKYAYYFMLSDQFRSEVRRRVGKAVNQVSLNQTNLKVVPFVVPPIETQIKLIKFFDKSFPAIEFSVKKIANSKRLLFKFRQAILSAAITGKLTEDWRKENSEKTKKVINFVSQVNKPKVQFRLDHFQTYDLPEGWEWKQFWEAAEIKSNLVKPDDYQDYVLVAPDNIERNTGKLLEKTLIKDIKPISAKHLFFNGQIVYSKIRPYLSKLILADFDGLCSADMYPISARINTKYVMYYMLSQYFLDSVSNLGTRTLLPKTNQEELNSIPIPVPTVEEQEQIVKQVDYHLNISQKIEEQITKAENQTAKLTQAVLSKTFSVQ